MTNPEPKDSGCSALKALFVKLTDLDADGIFSVPKAYKDTLSEQKNDICAKYGNF